MNNSGIYVFCAIQENKPKSFGSVKMNGKLRSIYTLHYENAAMVVCKVEGDVLPRRDNLFAHQETVSKIMADYSPIPISFGNVFNSEQDVIHIMKYLYPQFETLFPELHNKMEVGLKVIAKQTWLDQELQKDPTLMEWKKKMRQTKSDAAYYDQIKVGELAQKFMQSLQEQVERDIYEPLSTLAEAAKTNDTISEKMLLNAAYLIERNRETEFDEKVNELYESYKEKAEFKYSGPWPAYNFIDIRLKIEGKS